MAAIVNWNKSMAYALSPWCIYFRNRVFVAEQCEDPKGNKGSSPVTACMKHLANNQLPCIPLFRIWRRCSAGSSSYLCAVLHSGIKLSPIKVWWGFICWGKLTEVVRQRLRGCLFEKSHETGMPINWAGTRLVNDNVNNCQPRRGTPPWLAVKHLL